MWEKKGVGDPRQPLKEPVSFESISRPAYRLRGESSGYNLVDYEVPTVRFREDTEPE